MSIVIKNLSILYHYRYLLRMWIAREVKIRYKQAFLGATWAVLQPFALMIVFTIVFSFLARVPTDGIPYPIFSYTALLPWTLLATSVNFSTMSLVGNMNLVTKIYFPKEVLPLGSIGASMVDFGFGSLVFVGLMLVYHISLRPTLLWVPLLLAIQILLILGVSLLVSAANVFFRDIRFMVPLGMQIWLYATPIIYPITLVPDRLRPVYMLNPMAGLVESYRRVILQGLPPVPLHLGLAAGIALLLSLGAYLFFKSVEPKFADLI